MGCHSFVTASKDQTVRLWEESTGRCNAMHTETGNLGFSSLAVLPAPEESKAVATGDWARRAGEASTGSDWRADLVLGSYDGGLMLCRLEQGGGLEVVAKTDTDED